MLKWMREPDCAEEFSLADLTEWLNRRPVEGMCRAADAIVAHVHLPAGSSPELEAILKDPAAVHLNMLRGGIAMPSLENIKHLYPEVRDAFAAVEKGT